MTDQQPPIKATTNQLEALAQAHENEAFALLVETVRDKDVKIEHRLKAAERILDQARGKPKVSTSGNENQRKQKAISMSIETLMRLAQGAVNRVDAADRTRKAGAILEAEFTPRPRVRPVNEYALPAPQVPGTTDEDADDIEDLLA